MASSKWSRPQQSMGWKVPSTVYNEPRPENSFFEIQYTKPTTVRTTPSEPPFFIPTIPQYDRTSINGEKHKKFATSDFKFCLITENSMKWTTPLTPTTIRHTEGNHLETPKPWLHSLLKSETASAFVKKPSAAYKIELTSSIYRPEDINSMAVSLSSHTSVTPGSSSTVEINQIRPLQEKLTYIVPNLLDLHKEKFPLIIESHSKVKKYGSNDQNPINLLMIRPVQEKEVTQSLKN